MFTVEMTDQQNKKKKIFAEFVCRRVIIQSFAETISQKSEEQKRKKKKIRFSDTGIRVFSQRRGYCCSLVHASESELIGNERNFFKQNEKSTKVNKTAKATNKFRCNKIVFHIYYYYCTIYTSSKDVIS